MDEYGNPMPGVSILIKGTTRGVSTDFEGNFIIKASKDEVLAFSYIGFTSREIKLKKHNNLSRSMFEASAILNEVVVTAQGRKSRKKGNGLCSFNGKF